ncbi:hypothetical protein FOMPIDRAFT_56005 [Fomitopsis schrenkii]|uniref:Ubiquitin conjugation factor E4 core domain-containing protein n=1 Tax=Fomitopsis schrenkii TaxID=2126942 RepID=S8DVQ9_FOMSC|nr:hypothetical protein FOMPIDRAFT_56005 [Fomitopsis schrenkii]
MRASAEPLSRFINLLILDTTNLMDTMVSDLAQIHGMEQAMADTEGWNAQPPQDRHDRESALLTFQLQTPRDVHLAGSALEVLSVFTGEIKEPFLSPDIAERIAAMLNHILDALVCPACQNLAVRDPEKYQWDPKATLGTVIEVYLNLSAEGQFVRAVAADRENHRKELFERAYGIAKARHIRSDAELEAWLVFVSRVEEKRVVLELEAEPHGISGE